MILQKYIFGEFRLIPVFYLIRLGLRKSTLTVKHPLKFFFKFNFKSCALKWQKPVLDEIAKKRLN